MMKTPQKTNEFINDRQIKGEQENKEKTPVYRVILEIAVYLVLFFICIFIVPRFLVHTTIVDGDSMQPSLYDKENVILEKLSLHFNTLKRFDVIVFYPYEEDTKEQYIKRIIGLPGETVQIKDNIIYIDEKPLQEDFALEEKDLYGGRAEEPIYLAEDEYFVMGDNRELSYDSRYREIGNIKKSSIEGRLVLVFWPLKRFGPVR